MQALLVEVVLAGIKLVTLELLLVGTSPLATRNLRMQALLVEVGLISQQPNYADAGFGGNLTSTN